MSGSLTSRNSTTNGIPPSVVQQPTESLSNGRFTSNKIPVSLSQISHGSTLGHSGATNNGSILFWFDQDQRLEVSPSLGKSGSRITNSIGNIVGSGNIRRNLSSGGGLSMPGLASHLRVLMEEGESRAFDSIKRSSVALIAPFVSKHLTASLVDIETSQPQSKLCLEFSDIYAGCFRKSKMGPLMIRLAKRQKRRENSYIRVLASRESARQTIRRRQPC